MDPMVVSTPAVQRLGWLLDGLAGRWGAVTGAAEVLAPEFAAVVAPSRFVAVMRERAAVLAPTVVVGVEVEGESALAMIQTRDGRWVARVVVEPDPPHRIVSGYAQPWVPRHLTAALPARFAPGDLAVPARSRESVLVVFGGVPGSGKSAVAEGVGEALDLPVFALDWLLGAMSPFGMRHRRDLLGIGSELLTTLAFRELAAGRSAILDTPSEDVDLRARWQSLAAAAGATFVPVVCVCSDPALHRSRLEDRERGIPGWSDPGDWRDVSSRMTTFPPWSGSIHVDTARSLASCVARVVDAVG